MGKLVLTGNGRTRTRLADLGGGGVPTSPPALTDLKWWLDASDTATITATGSNITQWNDKSGNSANVTNSGTSPTTGNPGPHSMNVTDWTSATMVTGTGAITMTPHEMTFWAVLKWDVISVDAACVMACVNTVPSLDINTFVFERRTGNKVQAVTGNGQGGFSGSAFKEQYFVDSDTSNYHKVVIRRDRTNGLRFNFDGVSKTLTTGGGTCADSDFLLSSTTAWKITMCNRSGVTFDGKIAEIGMYNVAISDANVTLLESYLSRWF